MQGVQKSETGKEGTVSSRKVAAIMAG